MKKINLLSLILLAFAFASCNDDFLEKLPKTDLTEDNAFTSYDNFKSFLWPCYAIFNDGTIGTSLASWGESGQYRSDMDAGYLESKYTSGFNRFAFQTVSSVASGNGWNFSNYVRRTNIMLSHLGNSSMTAAEKNHWRAVAYFFHSYWYIELVSRFGDVPWVNKVLKENDEEAYGPRIDRKIVADSIMQRLKWAEENIGNFKAKDGANTIDRDCILALISRFGLREGTWRKYHDMNVDD